MISVSENFLVESNRHMQAVITIRLYGYMNTMPVQLTNICTIIIHNIGPAYVSCCYNKIVWLYEHEHSK
jgi:hypothetical protein